MKKRISFIVALLFLIGVLSLNQNFLKNIFNSPTAFAIGDLTVNWGVPEGNPIFTVSNIAPGQTEERIVQVSNGASSARPVGVRGIEATDSANLSDVMEMTISQGATDLYGGTTGIKTLTQFFTESSGINGIPLSILGPGINTNYAFKVKFSDSAGNEFQGQSIVFDLKIGITVDVPTDCSSIIFSGSPIFGTQGNDNINGTLGNDLIIGFEGNDRLSGGGGMDCIIGNEGNDILDGGLAKDFLFGNAGNDNLSGGLAEDMIIGGADEDIIDGGVGADKIEGNEGDDNILGGVDGDQIKGDLGDDKIDSGVGNDTVFGDDGNDNIKGGVGNDILDGGSNTDNIDGGVGMDTCIAETKIHCEL